MGGVIHYPSDEYLTYLMTVDEMMFTDEIDCSDLFGGNSERERIIIFVMESCDKMDWCNQDKYLYLRIPCYNRNTFSVDLT